MLPTRTKNCSQACTQLKQLDTTRPLRIVHCPNTFLCPSCPTVVPSCPQLSPCSKLSVLQVHSSPIFHCNFPNRPGRCGRKKNGCQLKHKGDVRQFASCQQKCPRRYPWVNNLNGD